MLPNLLHVFFVILLKKKLQQMKRKVCSANMYMSTYPPYYIDLAVKMCHSDYHQVIFRQMVNRTPTVILHNGLQLFVSFGQSVPVCSQCDLQVFVHFTVQNVN